MEYAALTFWLLVIVFTALGVHQIWSSLVRPKVVNSILLPGTLVAQLGYVLGLLITGGTVNNTALIKDDDSGEPQTDGDSQPRIPVIGTIIIALLPMIGCAVAIYWAATYFGMDILAGMVTSGETHLSLPTSLPLFFGFLRQCVNLAERFLYTLQSSDITEWRTALFLYLVICLTVRMAPLTGNLRGSLGAIFVFGVLAFLLGQVSSDAADSLQSAWPLVTFCVAALLFLLLASLLIKGLVDLIKTISENAS
jgi:hypothetical protein